MTPSGRTMQFHSISAFLKADSITKMFLCLLGLSQLTPKRSLNFPLIKFVDAFCTFGQCRSRFLALRILRCLPKDSRSPRCGRQRSIETYPRTVNHYLEHVYSTQQRNLDGNGVLTLRRRGESSEEDTKLDNTENFTILPTSVQQMNLLRHLRARYANKMNLIGRNVLVASDDAFTNFHFDTDPSCLQVLVSSRKQFMFISTENDLWTKLFPKENAEENERTEQITMSQCPSGRFSWKIK